MIKINNGTFSNAFQNLFLVASRALVERREKDILEHFKITRSGNTIGDKSGFFVRNLK